MRYIGIDLHKTSIVACYLENDKFTHKTFKIEDIDKFKQSLISTDELAVEATANSVWFHQQCKELVSRIVVINTSAFGIIACSVKKTDKNDAKTIARYLAKDMLPEIRVKNQQQQTLQTLFTTRKLLTKQTTMLKNEIHGILLNQGIKIKSEDLNSNVGLSRIVELVSGSEIAFVINALAEQLKVKFTTIKEFDYKLVKLGSQLPGYNNLNSIKGLGTNTIIMLLATIGNINNFVNHSKLSAYLGLIPQVRNSNQTIKHGRVTKQGNSLLRGNLTMCALSAVKYNKLFNDFYQRIKLKGGYKKAIVATANKLVKIVYYTLKYDWYFTDFCKQKREVRVINW